MSEKLILKPDSDIYPPYSEDYYKDMREWKSQTGCNYPECDCVKTLIKGSCKHENMSIVDMKKKYPDVII